MDGPYIDKYQFSFYSSELLGEKTEGKLPDVFSSTAYAVIYVTRWHEFQSDLLLD